MGDSLEKECIMALNRIWDSTKGALSLDKIFRDVSSKSVLDDIKKQRTAQVREAHYPPSVDPHFLEEFLDQLPPNIQEFSKRERSIKAEDEARKIPDKIDDDVARCGKLIEEVTLKSGSLNHVTKSLASLRNQQLAHCEVSPPVHRPPNLRRAHHGDERVLLFHTINIVELLSNILRADNLNFNSTIEGWKRISTNFWLSVYHMDNRDGSEIARAVERFFPDEAVGAPTPTSNK